MASSVIQNVGIVLSFMVSISSEGVGTWGLLQGWAVPELPHLFFGLEVLATVLFLLTLPLAWDVLPEHVRSCFRSRGDAPQARSLQPLTEPPPWACTPGDVCHGFGTDIALGLSNEGVQEHLDQFGPNSLPGPAKQNFLAFLVKEVYEPTQLLLLAVGVLYSLFGGLEEAAVAFSVILAMIVAEVGTEYRAKAALAALQVSSPRDALVLREGSTCRIDRTDVVPGDLVVLKPGLEVPADVRLIQATFLEVDESRMTGESAPVPKDPSMICSAEQDPLRCQNLALGGTLVTRGKGLGVAYRTGTSTQLGQTLTLSRSPKEKKTKLQKAMKETASKLTVVAIIASLAGALLGFLTHQSWKEIILSALSLAFATIPEELPILITAVLAVGSRSLSLQNIFVKQLRAAENLGFVDTVLTDKTGTLTENRLSLVGIFPPDKLDPSSVSPARELESSLSDKSLQVSEPVDESLSISEVGSTKQGAAAESGERPLLEAWLYMSEIGDGQVSKTSSTGPDGHSQPSNVYPAEGKALTTSTSSVSHNSRGRKPLSFLRKKRQSDARRGAEVEQKAVGDPFDQVLMEALNAEVPPGAVPSPDGGPDKSPVAAQGNGLPGWRTEVLQTLVEKKRRAKVVREVPFDERIRCSKRVFSHTDATGEVRFVEYVKGAPEVLVDSCAGAVWGGQVASMQEVGGQIREALETLAKEGLRMIGYAVNDLANEGSSATSSTIDGPEGGNGPESLAAATFVGLLAFKDPVRSNAHDAVRQCHLAGIRVIMVTGDHVETAQAAARSIGLLAPQPLKSEAATLSCLETPLQSLSNESLGEVLRGKTVLARATPMDKLKALVALQKGGACVAVTGDGVNDAPALANADVGLAMGLGTDVARDAASIVILDDNFGHLVAALKEGRRLLDNLRKALAFYLGAKAGLVSIFIVGTISGSYPLAPIQIIVLELFMDLGASTSFVLEPADSDVMSRPPRRPSQPFFDSQLLTAILTSAVVMAGTVLFSFSIGLDFDSPTAQSCAFLAWLISHVLLAFNMRTFRQPVALKGLLGNKAMLLWLASALGLTMVLTFSGTARAWIHLERVSGSLLCMVVLVSIFGTCWLELWKWLLLLVLSKQRKKGNVMNAVGESSELKYPLLA